MRVMVTLAYDSHNNVGTVTEDLEVSAGNGDRVRLRLSNSDRYIEVSTAQLKAAIEAVTKA